MSLYKGYDIPVYPRWQYDLLKDLIDNAGARANFEATSDPGSSNNDSSDPAYYNGAVWHNTETGRTWILIDEANGTWIDVSGRLEKSVLEYGAVGDGTTDDTEAIQLALDDVLGSDGTLFFPARAYRITDTIHINTRLNGRVIFESLKPVSDGTPDSGARILVDIDKTRSSGVLTVTGQTSDTLTCSAEAGTWADDYWNGYWIRSDEDSNGQQYLRVTDFDGSTCTFTVDGDASSSNWSGDIVLDVYPAVAMYPGSGSGIGRVTVSDLRIASFSSTNSYPNSTRANGTDGPPTGIFVQDSHNCKIDGLFVSGMNQWGLVFVHNYYFDLDNVVVKYCVKGGRFLAPNATPIDNVHVQYNWEGFWNITHSTDLTVEANEKSGLVFDRPERSDHVRFYMEGNNNGDHDDVGEIENRTNNRPYMAFYGSHFSSSSRYDASKTNPDYFFKGRFELGFYGTKTRWFSPDRIVKNDSGTIGNAPPANPETNGNYAVGQSPTGAWSGEANKIATWDGAAWSFSDPDGDVYLSSNWDTTNNRPEFLRVVGGVWTVLTGGEWGQFKLSADSIVLDNTVQQQFSTQGGRNWEWNDLFVEPDNVKLITTGSSAVTMTDGATVIVSNFAETISTNNTSDTTITDILGGYEGQKLTVYINDDNTTLQGSSRIQGLGLTSTGRKLKLSNGDIIIGRFVDSVWNLTLSKPTAQDQGFYFHNTTGTLVDGGSDASPTELNPGLTFIRSTAANTNDTFVIPDSAPSGAVYRVIVISAAAPIRIKTDGSYKFNAGDDTVDLLSIREYAEYVVRTNIQIWRTV